MSLVILIFALVGFRFGMLLGRQFTENFLAEKNWSSISKWFVAGIIEFTAGLVGGALAGGYIVYFALP